MGHRWGILHVENADISGTKRCEKATRVPPMTVEITKMALFERLQRALRKRGMFLRLADSRKQKRWGLGRYYIVGPKGVIETTQPWESLSE
jgi:hypothetical protein